VSRIASIISKAIIVAALVFLFASCEKDTIESEFDSVEWIMPAWEPNPSDYSGQPSGNFRMFCQFSHLAYADPIVDPGNDEFEHLHMFFGNTGADHDSTYASLRQTGGSTCDGGPLNRTAYWMPAIFDENDDVVVPSSFELYYKLENTSPGTLEEKQKEIQNSLRYTNGLRMIAGAPDSSAVWGWRCEGGPSFQTIPNCGGGRLTGWVRFPYCWDQGDHTVADTLDSPDHRSHMAYGTNNTWGGCPVSHYWHMPELTEFVHIDNAHNSDQWYLSSDMGAPNGSTFHADWFGAWDPVIQDRWIDNCLKGMKSASNGNLCDGEQLKPAPQYSGPDRISGWTPMP
jgi:hypothetical protein